MCDSTEFKNWEATCIQYLLNTPGADLELLIIDDRTEKETQTTGDGWISSALQEKRENIRILLDYWDKTTLKDTIDLQTWQYYKNWTSILDPPPDAYQMTDLSEELASTDEIHCEVQEDGFSEYFSEDDIDRIRDYDLDFVFRVGFGIIRGEILEVPKYGVWSFHHDDERKYRGGPACLWEILKGDPITGAILQRLTDRLDSGIVLRRGHFRTRDRWAENIDNVLYGSAEWPAQVVTDILNENASYLHEDPSTTDAPIYRNPSAVQLSTYHVRNFLNRVDDHFTGRTRWNIGVVKSSAADLVCDTDAFDVDWCPQPVDDGFVADPFPMTVDDTQYIFAEYYSDESEKGTIVYVNYPDGFKNGKFEVAHEESHHLSYPYLFRHDGVVYAVPEASQSGEVTLYRVDAPDEWTSIETIVPDTAAVDPSVFRYEDRWWLFFSPLEYEHEKLHIWYASHPAGDWKPHENNPVKADVRSARPGGTPFVADNTLYRPAQFCATGYGKRTLINEVTTLSPTAFEEETIRQIRPLDEYPDGLHTLSTHGNLTLVDGKKHVWDRDWTKKRIKQLFT